MSTAQLKEIIDRRTAQECKWPTAYLLDKVFSVSELRQAAEKKKGAVCVSRSNLPAKEKAGAGVGFGDFTVENPVSRQ